MSKIRWKRRNPSSRASRATTYNSIRSPFMRKRLLFYSGLAVLAILVAIIVWQGSFSFGPLAPTSVEQTYLFWAVSTLIFILTVTLGFMLFRTAVKLYIERRRNLAGSHIRSKLVAGALALTFLPVFFLVLFRR